MRWLLPLVLLWGPVARAHDADVIYVLLRHGARPEVLVETVTLTAATLALLAPVDADGDLSVTQGELDERHRALRAGFWDEAPLAAAGSRCELLDASASMREGFIELQAQFRCAEGELRQDFRILRVLPTNYRVVVGSQLDGEGRGGSFAQGSLTTVALQRPPPQGSWDGARFLGAFHAGVARGLWLEVLAAFSGLLIAIGAWRRSLLAAGLAVAAVGLGSWFAADWWPPTLLLLLVVAGAAASKAPPLILPVLLGLCVGLREGGGAWPACLGVAAGTGLVLGVASPVAIAVGVLLRRRPRIFKVARWVPVALAVVGAAVHSRLWW